MANENGTLYLFLLGLVMIIIYLFIDSSFPVIYFLFAVLGIHLYNKDFPIYQLLIVLICIYFLYYLIKLVLHVLMYGCGKHKPALMIERFANENDSSLAYFKKLNKRLSVLDSKLDQSTSQLESIIDKYNGFQADICIIMKEIDDGIEGNYASNVPDDEALLPPEDQRSRSNKRKERAKVHVKNLKSSYSKSNKDVPIVECFDTTPDDVAQEKQSLLDNLELVQGKFTNLKENLSRLKKTLSAKQISMYYVSLGYNEKYLKQLLKAASKPSKEGFESGDPVGQIETMESEYEPLLNEIAEIQKNVFR
jgi:DNA repair exonuclease SbcCD ATPase subunit